MKRLLCVILSALMLLSLAACGDKEDTPPTDPSESSAPTDVSGSVPDTTPDTTPDMPSDTTSPEPTAVFSDVPESAVYYDAAMWAAESGLISGDKFDPMGICNRGQMLTLLWRAMGSPEPANAENPFTDGDASSWFYKQALWAFENGIISGGNVSVSAPCSMAQLLTFLWRANGSPLTATGASAAANKYAGQYYEKPLAWADLCGLLNAVGQAFAPNASCTRATVVMYLYWLHNNFTPSPDEAAVQAEYAKLVSDAPLYGLTGNGLVYADYIDVEGDGKVELLTVGLGDGEDYYKNLTLTVYANVDGHAGKVAELTDEINIIANHVTFTLSFDPAEEGPRLNYYDTSENPHTFYEDFGQYLLESNAFTKAEIGQSYAEYYDLEGEEGQTVSGESVSAEEFRVAADKNNTGTPILTFQSSFGEASATVENSGLLPNSSELRGMIISKIKAGDADVKAHVLDLIRDGDEDMIALVTDMILGGDFSAVSGTYTLDSSASIFASGSVTLLPDGTLYAKGSDDIENHISGHQPIRITSDRNVISVLLENVRFEDEVIGYFYITHVYDIYLRQTDIAETFGFSCEGPVICYNIYDGGVWDATFVMAD